MTIKALRAILSEAGELYHSAGDEKAVAILREFSRFLESYDSKTVGAFVKLAAKVNS